MLLLRNKAHAFACTCCMHLLRYNLPVVEMLFGIEKPWMFSATTRGTNPLHVFLLHHGDKKALSVFLYNLKKWVTLVIFKMHYKLFPIKFKGYIGFKLSVCLFIYLFVCLHVCLYLWNMIMKWAAVFFSFFTIYRLCTVKYESHIFKHWKCFVLELKLYISYNYLQYLVFS